MTTLGETTTKDEQSVLADRGKTGAESPRTTPVVVSPNVVPEAARPRPPLPPIVHPLTGEILPDDLETLRDLEANVDRFLRRLGVHYGFRGNLRERIAELQGPALLPKPRNRTDKQGRVAACPRCGRE